MAQAQFAQFIRCQCTQLDFSMLNNTSLKFSRVGSGVQNMQTNLHVCLTQQS